MSTSKRTHGDEKTDTSGGIVMNTHETSNDLAARLRRMSDRISSLILYSDMPWVDIAIEIEKMREICLSEAPDKPALFEHLYENRFHRLWKQWREEEEEV